jgi:hypothetical protein
MATLHLICGLPCAGKTTFARQLEQARPALRLTPDEWHIRLFGMDFLEAEATHDERHNLVEALMWEVAARVLALGRDVILAFGFWTQSEREDFCARAAQLGASSEVHYLAVPEKTLLERLTARNALHPENTFIILAEKLKAWVTLFQPPTPDELKRREPL